ncbi:MAG: hypothetical protein GF364_12990 [Candidatus Lokiarchaeota archaeon]|nr:hypothetical protein [Candidatus Lokiarchaeota archaeon]
MDRKEAESLLGVTHQTLQNWAKAGKVRVEVANGIIIDYNDEDIYNRLKITSDLIIRKLLVSINRDLDENTANALNLARSKADILDKLVKNQDSLGNPNQKSEQDNIEDVEEIIKGL